MTEGDSRKTDEIYRAAAKLRSEERATYLLKMCGNDIALRQQVEALLHQDDLAAVKPTDIADVAGDEVTSGTKTSVISPTDRGVDEKTLVATLPDQPGDDSDGAAPRQRWIGPYRLLEQLGEGGMGTVWRAEQTSPVRRTVAIKVIKVIKGGMATGSVIARFEQERQALALMDHPNIATVLDAGTTQDNQPYFVMELVPGTPVTRFCDSQRLSPRQRLELFIPICKAIQHAHQKGIIHRDIKPSNILVALYDGKPIPKVIDFGIAKAMGNRCRINCPLLDSARLLAHWNICLPSRRIRMNATSILGPMSIPWACFCMSF
ncbi:MAG: serine/threonine protein kinase [Fuerstiella sp.]|nr:serine/threonine protein kinase [Fuerstiella sp.]